VEGSFARSGRFLVFNFFMAKLKSTIIFRNQLSEVKYSLIKKSIKKYLTKEEKKEHTKLKIFMMEFGRFLIKKTITEPCIPIPEPLLVTLRLKTKVFIKENCPLYTKRLK
jgi:hypothetical protein